MKSETEQNRSGARPVSGRLLLAAGLLALTALPAGAQDAAGLLQSLSGALAGGGIEDAATGSLSGRIIQMIGLITVLSLAPGLVIMTTSFTRFVIVFSMLRSALGLNQTPPNMVITGMALFMTFFVMQPVFEASWESGLEPLIESRITEEQALPLIIAPFKEFMFTHARPQDLELFHDMAMRNAGVEAAPLPQTAAEASIPTLIPAFMISELRRAFLIGFMIYLPFLAIDLIVAAILMSAGMMMLPPVLISLPFKVIFFVLIDGWYMVAGSLLSSFFAAG